MQVKDAYFEVFRILDEYWEKVKLDDLGNMLSDLSPYTFQSDAYVSADPAEYENWKTAWARIVGADNEGTAEQVYLVACTILDYYTNEVQYDIGDSRYVLQEGLGLPPDQFRKAM